MMPLRPLRVPLALLLVVAPVLADAPPDQYRPFVRTDPEIRDAQTGLIWLRAPSAAVPFSGAVAACPPNGPVIYRVPTVKELLTLVDEQPHSEYEDGGLVSKTIDESAFPSTPAVSFWTGSAYAQDASMAWTVDFSTGIAEPHAKIESHPVRCVRP